MIRLIEASALRIHPAMTERYVNTETWKPLVKLGNTRWPPRTQLRTRGRGLGGVPSMVKSFGTGRDARIIAYYLNHDASLDQLRAEQEDHPSKGKSSKLLNAVRNEVREFDDMRAANLYWRANDIEASDILAHKAFSEATENLGLKESQVLEHAKMLAPFGSNVPQILEISSNLVKMSQATQISPADIGRKAQASYSTYQGLYADVKSLRDEEEAIKSRLPQWMKYERLDGICKAHNIDVDKFEGLIDTRVKNAALGYTPEAEETIAREFLARGKTPKIVATEIEQDLGTSATLAESIGKSRAHLKGLTQQITEYESAIPEMKKLADLYSDQIPKLDEIYRNKTESLEQKYRQMERILEENFNKKKKDLGAQLAEEEGNLGFLQKMELALDQRRREKEGGIQFADAVIKVLANPTDATKQDFTIFVNALGSLFPSSGTKKEMSNLDLEAGKKAILRGLTTLVKANIVSLEDYKNIVNERDTFQQKYSDLLKQSQTERQELGKALSAEKAKTTQSEAIALRFAEVLLPPHGLQDRLFEECPKCRNDDTILVGEEEIEELKSSTGFEHHCQFCENNRVIDAKTLYSIVRKDFLS